MSLLKKPLVNRMSARVRSLEIDRPYVAPDAGRYLAASMFREDNVASFENVGINGLGVCRTVVEVGLDDTSMIQSLHYTESVRRADGSEMPIVEFGGVVGTLSVKDLGHAALAINSTVAVFSLDR